MKTKRKALLLSVCAMLLVAASVMGTMAYLTAKTSAVQNTFTVGSVNITLDEADVDNSTSGASRDQANAYNLLPGNTYEKDPTIHVAADSEDCWVFVKVKNDLADFEAKGTGTIAAQIAANGWTQLSDASGNAITGVYYRQHTKAATATDYVVFSTLTIADNANTLEGWSNISGEMITVTGYAVQDANVETALDAWNLVKDL